MKRVPQSRPLNPRPADHWTGAPPLVRSVTAGRSLAIEVLIAGLLIGGLTWCLQGPSVNVLDPLARTRGDDQVSQGPTQTQGRTSALQLEDTTGVGDTVQLLGREPVVQAEPSLRVVLVGWQAWDWTGATPLSATPIQQLTGSRCSPEDPLATQLKLLYVLIDPGDPSKSLVRVRYRESLADFDTEVLHIGDHLPPPWGAAELRHVREDAVVFGFDETVWSSRIPEVLAASSDGGKSRGTSLGTSLGTGHGSEGGRRMRPRQAPELPVRIMTAVPRMDRASTGSDTAWPEKPATDNGDPGEGTGDSGSGRADGGGDDQVEPRSGAGGF
jgi:hypothetical protein